MVISFNIKNCQLNAIRVNMLRDQEV